MIRRAFLRSLAGAAAALAVPFKAKAKASPARMANVKVVHGPSPEPTVIHTGRFAAHGRDVGERDWPSIRAADKIEISDCDLYWPRDTVFLGKTSVVLRNVRLRLEDGAVFYTIQQEPLRLYSVTLYQKYPGSGDGLNGRWATPLNLIDSDASL